MSAPFMLPVEDDPFNFARYADPYPNYRRVRETTPVYWSQLLGGWVLTRHADVKAALVDKRLSAARARDAQSAQLSEDLRRQLAPVDELLRRWALFQDNPDHRRIRQALSGAFTSGLLEQLRQRVQEIADGLIDAVRGRREMDLVADFALRLPAMVIAQLLGMSSGDSERFQRWVHTIALYFAIGSLGSAETIAALRETVEEMADYMRAIVDDHRRAPRDDLIGKLLGSGTQDEPLSEVEILSQCMLLLHGGYESTMNTISSGMLHLLRDPDQRRLCVEDPGLAGAAVEEALRYEPAFQFVVRAAAADLDVGGEAGGQAIQAGQQVVCVLAAANRDPAQFADPERFDIRRDPNPHLSFGYGPHFCIGAALARMEGQIAFNTLLRRLRDLRLAIDTPQWRPAFGVRSLETLPVTFSTVGPAGE
ncbi:MAG TPA: cytochrome P450 [Thermoanaerobaculia bacterium]